MPRPKDAGDVGAAFHFLVQALSRADTVQLGAMLAREGHAGQHVMPAPVHEGGRFRPPRPEQTGHLTPHLSTGCATALRIRWTRQRCREASQTRSMAFLRPPCARHAADPDLLYNGEQRLLRGLAGLRKAGEAAALAQPGNLEV